MDGENNGKPYEQMDDLGVPLFLESLLYQLMVAVISALGPGLESRDTLPKPTRTTRS